MSGNKTPLALFTYNRSEHTRRALAALARCDRLDECNLHIYCDGARTPEQSEAVEASREVVREYAARLSATVVERPENLGLARSIVTGVTELCQACGRVIVVEDDLIVSPDFLNYMLQALERYTDAAQVYQVAGYMYNISPITGPDAFFLPMTTTWGWATWQRAWKSFDWNATDAREALDDASTRRSLDLDGSYPFAAMLLDRLDGKNQSWGILWWWVVFKARGLVLYPRQSLVWQGGFDGSGVHCGASSGPTQAPPENFLNRRLPQTIVWPNPTISDPNTFHRVKDFLRQSSQQPTEHGSAVWRILNSIYRQIQRRISI